MILLVDLNAGAGKSYAAYNFVSYTDCYFSPTLWEVILDCLFLVQSVFLKRAWVLQRY